MKSPQPREYHERILGLYLIALAVGTKDGHNTIFFFCGRRHGRVLCSRGASLAAKVHPI